MIVETVKLLGLFVYGTILVFLGLLLGLTLPIWGLAWLLWISFRWFTRGLCWIAWGCVVILIGLAAGLFGPPWLLVLLIIWAITPGLQWLKTRVVLPILAWPSRHKSGIGWAARLGSAAGFLVATSLAYLTLAHGYGSGSLDEVTNWIPAGFTALYTAQGPLVVGLSIGFMFTMVYAYVNMAIARRQWKVDQTELWWQAAKAQFVALAGLGPSFFLGGLARNMYLQSHTDALAALAGIVLLYFVQGLIGGAFYLGETVFAFGETVSLQEILLEDAQMRRSRTPGWLWWVLAMLLFVPSLLYAFGIAGLIILGMINNPPFQTLLNSAVFFMGISLGLINQALATFVGYLFRRREAGVRPNLSLAAQKCVLAMLSSLLSNGFSFGIGIYGAALIDDAINPSRLVRDTLLVFLQQLAGNIVGLLQPMINAWKPKLPANQ